MPNNQFFWSCIIIRKETKAKLNELEFKARAKKFFLILKLVQVLKNKKNIGLNWLLRVNSNSNMNQN